MDEIARCVANLPDPYGLGLLRAVGEAGPNALPALVSEYPGLVSARVLRRLRRDAEGASIWGRRSLSRTLEQLEGAAAAINGDFALYPLGRGPIEHAAAEVERGVINSEVARQRVCEPAVRVAMTPYYVWALLRAAIADGRSPRWRSALTVGRLAVAATNAAGDQGERADARRQAELDFLILAGAVLKRVPDGRLLLEARDVGDRAIARATAENNRVAVGQATYRIGTLYLDPYAGIGSLDEKTATRRLAERLHAEIGDEILLDDVAQAFPSPGDALAQAETYYRRSLADRDGHERGMAAKALLQTLTLKRHLGRSVDPNEFEALGLEALALLDPMQAPQMVDDVHNWLSDL